MTKKKKFEAFKAQTIKENEERYGAEVRQRWGNDVMDKSNAKASQMDEGTYERQQQLAQDILAQLKIAMATGSATSDEARKLAQMHATWLRGWWPDGMYSPEAHKALTDAHVADARFTAYYDEPVGVGATAFLRDAVHANV